jgi:hypothetical protein
MKRRSKIIATAIPILAILAGLAAYDYAYLPVLEREAALREMQDAKLKTLEKSADLLASKPALEKRLAELREARKAEDAKLIEGQTPSLAAAALQNAVKGTIMGRGGTLSSERVEKPDDLARFRLITINVDAGLPDVRALSDTLYTIETRTPWLVIREIDARVKNFREPRELTVRMKISALTRKR